MALSGFPPNFNTLSNDGNDTEIGAMLKPMMPRAFSTDASGALSVNHDYFTDVALTGTDPQQVTYTIDPKAVWSDGTPITWADIQSQAAALSGENKDFLIANTSGFERVDEGRARRRRPSGGDHVRRAVRRMEGPVRGQFDALPEVGDRDPRGVQRESARRGHADVGTVPDRVDRQGAEPNHAGPQPRVVG